MNLHLATTSSRSILAVLLVLFPLVSAEAVQTRNCPLQVTVAFSQPSLLSHPEIKSHVRHAKYSSTMLTEALNSRDRAEKHLSQTTVRTPLPLVKRENGRCYYRDEERLMESARAPSHALKSHRVVLYTKNGRDLFREELELPYQRRESETFVIESTLADYSVSGIKLSENEPTEFMVTVRYPCYDDRCLSSATIGSIHQYAE